MKVRILKRSEISYISMFKVTSRSASKNSPLIDFDYNF